MYGKRIEEVADWMRLGNRRSEETMQKTRVGIGGHTVNRVWTGTVPRLLTTTVPESPPL